MRTDELVRELRAQAEEMQDWPLPRTRRPAPARHRLRTAGVVLASAAAVVSVLVVPRLLDRDPVGGPATTPSASPGPGPQKLPSPQSWSEVECEDGQLTCLTPAVLEYDGRQFLFAGSGQVDTIDGATITRSYQQQRSGPGAVQWVLVGARGSGRASDLAVQFNDGAPQPLASGRLSLVRAPEDLPVNSVVRVLERARPVPDERIVVAEYTPR